MKNILFKVALAAVLLAASSAHAVTFTLSTSTATIVPGNATSAFYESTGFADSGTMGATFTFTNTLGVGNTTPPKIEIFFNGAQPTLTSAFWKAGNDYMFWDSTDLISFNAGVFTSITLVGDGLLNPPGNAYLALSHAGLTGTSNPNNPPGGPGVPDGGSTAAMLGLGLIAMAVAVRRRR